MHFELLRLRLRFRARQPILFPAGKPGNAVRGAFGNALRRLGCAPDCADPHTCPRPGQCPYTRIFQPRASDPGPSGLADQPRPFIFRAAHLDGRTIPPGEEFTFYVHVFDLRDPDFSWYTRGFAEAGRQSIGVRHGIAELIEAAADPPEPVRILLDKPVAARKVQVRFATPTELKAGQRIADKPEFHVLFARIRDRLSTLRAIYGPGPLEIDFRALATQAAAVRMTRCQLNWSRVERRSGRTGQTHALGGFTGVADYEGDLSPFAGYLEAARWTGVGRHTVWGMGEISLNY